MALKKHEASVHLNLMACLVLTNKSHAAIAEIVGCSREHVTRSLESPDGMELMTRLRAETQSQIFDPVQQQLDQYSRQAAQELWELKNETENERLKKDILIDVMHMAGFRPHTNTDKQAEQLPTIIMGNVNIQQNNGEGPQPRVTAPDVQPLLPEEIQNGESESGSRGVPVEQDEERGRYQPVEASDEPGFVSVSRWASGPIKQSEDGENGSGAEHEGTEQFEPSFPVEL